MIIYYDRNGKIVNVDKRDPADRPASLWVGLDGSTHAKPYETRYNVTEVRALFDSLAADFGPCRGSVHVDRPNGHVARVGWIFGNEVWVTLCMPSTDEPGLFDMYDLSTRDILR